jgi:DNA-directed RNA polymerase specialized sigma24 family protein
MQKFGHAAGSGVVDPPPDNTAPTSFTNIEETIRAYDRELRGFLLRRLRGQAQLSEDVRQEIYLRMLRFTDAALVRDARAYLYRVARCTISSVGD